MTHYETLGVAVDATLQQIKAAFRKLASQHHPDRGGDTARAAAINDAYACLSDSERRARYDSGMDDQAPPSAEEILRAKALQILDAVFDVALADPAIEASGLIRTVRRELTAAGKKLGSQAVDARAAAKRLERIKGKLLRKTGAEGDDLAAAILDRKAAEHLRRATDADDNLAQVNMAVSMLTEYGDEAVASSAARDQATIVQQMLNAQFGGYYFR